MTETRLSKRNAKSLVQAASDVLDFLEEVGKFPGLYAGPILNQAIRRYKVYWLPLAAKQGKESRLLAAPLDIAWVWHVHLLSPSNYQQVCLSIASKVIDHAPMNRNQREEGLQRARKIWEKHYPGESFYVDLTKPTKFFRPYTTELSYNLEKACYHHFSFYHQVSLPHFADRKYLAKAVERYDDHLRLQNRNKHIPMIPCYDVDLIWCAHLQFPLHYKAEMFGEFLQQRNHCEAGFSLGSTLANLETTTRAVWEAAGLQFDRAGAMFRGEPPLAHRPPRPPRLYEPLARLINVLDILKIEVLNADATETFCVRLFDPNGKLILLQEMKGGSGVDLTNCCKVDNENTQEITVSLQQKLSSGEQAIGSSQASMMSYLDSFYDGGPKAEPWSKHPRSVNVPFSDSQIVVRLTVRFKCRYDQGYRFTVLPDLVFSKYDQLSAFLNFPQAVLSPSTFVMPFLPCEAATHTLLDIRGREAFKCSVVHSTAAVLSAVEIINIYDDTVASANTITSAVLPDKQSIESEKNCVTLKEGERAMLIRGRKNWGICVGKWKKGKLFQRSVGQVKITFFSLHQTKGWCEVRKYRQGLYLIYIDLNNYVFVDLKRGIFVVCPFSKNIPEMIALAFSVSILYLLCKPYTSSRSKKSSPSSHKKAKGDRITPMLLAAGYNSTSVPTNVYLGHKACSPFVGCGTYDLDSESGCYWHERRKQFRGAYDTEEASLYFALNGAVDRPVTGSETYWLL